ncbi:hypothetical protein J6590_063607 [Homalodisca vitripennis]|nr:hypothetical protein J6590_063607 [Homalodisca vitripennis]
MTQYSVSTVTVAAAGGDGGGTPGNGTHYNSITGTKLNYIAASSSFNYLPTLSTSYTSHTARAVPQPLPILQVGDIVKIFTKHELHGRSSHTARAVPQPLPILQVGDIVKSFTKHDLHGRSVIVS